MVNVIIMLPGTVIAIQADIKMILSQLQLSQEHCTKHAQVTEMNQFLSAANKRNTVCESSACSVIK